MMARVDVRELVARLVDRCHMNSGEPATDIILGEQAWHAIGGNCGPSGIVSYRDIPVSLHMGIHPWEVRAQNGHRCEQANVKRVCERCGEDSGHLEDCPRREKHINRDELTVYSTSKSASIAQQVISEIEKLREVRTLDDGVTPLARDPYAPSRPPKQHFTMLLKARLCCTCRGDMPRGALVREKPAVDKRFVRFQCGPCAAHELLPLYDEWEARHGG